MKPLRRVVWSKGMFLTPQHFQAQDSFHSDALQFRFSQSCYANWGVSSLAIDMAAIPNGEINLTRARGILPDGLPFDIPDADPAPAGRPFRDHIASRDYLDVYLAIPEASPASKIITHFSQVNGNPAPGAASTRYTAETVTNLDENLGTEDKQIQIVRKNFRLLFSGEMLDGSTTLRIARISRDENGKFVLQPEFIAPCLDIASSDYLMGLVKTEVELLRNKSITLAASRRQKGQGLAEFGTSDVANFWLLHTANTYRPGLNHIWKTRHSHPELLFVTMLALAGALSTFAVEEVPPELPEYDHSNLGPCFTLLDARIRTLLDTVIPSKCISIPLRQTPEKAVWTGAIANDQYFRDSQFYLSISSHIPIDDLIGRVHKLVKIAAPDEIQHLIRWALPGVSLRHSPTPPPTCPFRMGAQHFALSEVDQLWDGIVKARTISVFVPGDIPDPKMELLIVLK